MKQLPKRLERAIEKLYTAFHGGELLHGICDKCAVGTLCGGSDWMGYIDGWDWGHNKKEADRLIASMDYSLSEIIKIEKAFESQNKNGQYSKENQFKGLCAVIKYLCELDGIEDVTDLTKLFEYTDSNEPKYQLT